MRHFTGSPENGATLEDPQPQCVGKKACQVKSPKWISVAWDFFRNWEVAARVFYGRS
jgi:hypothetical protein